jgi:hypothetical protein
MWTHNSIFSFPTCHVSFRGPCVWWFSWPNLSSCFSRNHGFPAPVILRSLCVLTDDPIQALFQTEMVSCLVDIYIVCELRLHFFHWLVRGLDEIYQRLKICEILNAVLIISWPLIIQFMWRAVGTWSESENWMHWCIELLIFRCRRKVTGAIVVLKFEEVLCQITPTELIKSQHECR